MIVAERRVNVRDALPADLEKVVELARSVQRMFPMGENLDYFDGAEGRALMQYHIEKGWVRLAESDGQLVGGCGYTIRYGRPEQSFFRHAELRLIYVEPSARGQGVGSQLMRSFLEAAERRDTSAVTTSLPTTDSLASFLAHFGFQEQRRLFMRPNPCKSRG